MIVVIGAGPAGLASAAMLQGVDERVVVLERGDVGAAWTTRYDRLHLHTVRWLSCLPGYRMPSSFGKWPSHDRVLEYLQQYSERHALDVRSGIGAVRVVRGGTAWVVETTEGKLRGERVVVATGYSNVPFLPEWPPGRWSRTPSGRDDCQRRLRQTSRDANSRTRSSRRARVRQRLSPSQYALPRRAASTHASQSGHS